MRSSCFSLCAAVVVNTMPSNIRLVKSQCKIKCLEPRIQDPGLGFEIQDFSSCCLSLCATGVVKTMPFDIRLVS
jgi:hypothetical protein